MSQFKKLNNQPLKLVLAEFRFSEVLKIADYLPDLQEAWRKKYPLCKENLEQVVSMFGPSNFEVSTAKRWAFISADKTHAIEVDAHRIIFYSSRYSRFEGFAEMCKDALSTLKKIVDPTLVIRIGLRYSDLIVLEDGEKIDDLVQSEFSFPSCLNNIGRAKQKTENLCYQTDVGLLTVRTLYGEHTLTCMPDIHNLPVTIETESEQTLRMILDFDHVWHADEPSPFEVKSILKKLVKLHDKSRSAFWNMTTSYAKDTKWA